MSRHEASSQESPAIRLYGHQYSARQEIREALKRDAGGLFDAHHFATSALFQMLERSSGKKISDQPKQVEARMTLSALIVQGIEVCETCAAEGQYVQAATLIRQQLETLIAMDEHKRGTRQDGKTPRVGKGIAKDWGPLYGRLSRMAHASWEDMERSLVSAQVGDLVGPSIVPSYNKEIAIALYGYAAYIVFETARLINEILIEINGEGMNEEEAAWLMYASNEIVKSGVLEREDEVSETEKAFIEKVSGGG